MARFLFWNTAKRPVEETLAALVRDHECDVVCLAECTVSKSRLLEILNAEIEPPLFSIPNDPSGTLLVLTRFPRDSMVPIHDGPGVVIRRFAPPIGAETLLVFVHLPSKLHRESRDQVMVCMRLARDIREAEQKVGHSRTLVLGDFNMNPFEVGLVGSAGLHATMDRRIARRGARVVRGEESRYMYNPMWGHLGDRTDAPPGSYYYDTSTEVNFYWNLFDQVLIRPALIDVFDDKSLKIVSNAGPVSLLTKSGVPNKRTAADHLPLIFALAIEELDDVDSTALGRTGY